MNKQNKSQNKSITIQKEHDFIIETTSKPAPASKNMTLYEGMRELLQVINAITEKALQSLAKDHGTTADQYTYINNAKSAVQAVTSNKSNKIITNFAVYAHNCCELWNEFFNISGFEYLDIIENNEEYSKGLETITADIIDIVTYQLCYFFKFWTFKQILNNEYSSHKEIINGKLVNTCFNYQEELKTLFTNTDSAGVKTYFKIIQNYAIDATTDSIFHVDKFQQHNEFEEYTFTAWRNNNSLPYTIKRYILKDGEREAQIVDIGAFIFNKRICKIYKRYFNSSRFSPYNPLTTYRDNIDNIDLLDFCNSYHPPFFEMPVVDPDSIQACEEMYQEFLEIENYLCDYQNELVQFDLDYLAHLVQKPYEGVEYIMLYVSKERGVGKGVSLAVWCYLVGAGNYTDIGANFENIIGHYNIDIARTILQFKEELGTKTSDGRKIAEYPLYKEEIKKLVAKDSAWVSGKWVKGHMARIFPRIVLHTNNKNEISVDGKSDRRLVIHVANEDTKKREKIKELAINFGHKLDQQQNGQIGREFIKYMTLKLLQRQISPTFAHDFNKTPILRRLILKYAPMEITAKYEVCKLSLYDLAIELQAIKEHRQRSLGDYILLENKERKKQLETIEFNANKRVIYDAKTCAEIVQDLKRQDRRVYISDSPMLILNTYLKNRLDVLNAYGNIELQAGYIIGKNGRYEATNDSKQLSYFWSDFIKKYPSIMQSNKPTSKGNCYTLAPNFEELIINIVDQEDQELE